LEPYLTENALPVFPDIGRAEGPPMQRKPRWRGASKIGDRFSIPLEMFVELRGGRAHCEREHGRARLQGSCQHRADGRDW
jgi:proline racemase